jgi:hypothetical protein
MLSRRRKKKKISVKTDNENCFNTLKIDDFTLFREQSNSKKTQKMSKDKDFF